MMKPFHYLQDEAVFPEDNILNDDYDREHRQKKELTEKLQREQKNLKNKDNLQYRENDEDNLQ